MREKEKIQKESVSHLDDEDTRMEVLVKSARLTWPPLLAVNAPCRGMGEGAAQNKKRK